MNAHCSCTGNMWHHLIQVWFAIIKEKILHYKQQNGPARRNIGNRHLTAAVDLERHETSESLPSWIITIYVAVRQKKGNITCQLQVQGSVMEFDGVHGQARMTFRGVLTAVPAGCCQATVGPEWPPSTLQHLPSPMSPGPHTFASQSVDWILLLLRDRTAQHVREVKWNGYFSYRCTSNDEWCFLN